MVFAAGDLLECGSVHIQLASRILMSLRSKPGIFFKHIASNGPDSSSRYVRGTVLRIGIIHYGEEYRDIPTGCSVDTSGHTSRTEQDPHSC